MLHRAAVSDKALDLLMDRCRATFANPEPGAPSSQGSMIRLSELISSNYC
jgi:hypothetical protein